jgi:hypothetical protein
VKVQRNELFAWLVACKGSASPQKRNEFNMLAQAAMFF